MRMVFPGGKLNAGNGSGKLRNDIYKLVNSSNVDGLVSWASSISGSVPVQEVEKFHNRFQNIPFVTIGQKISEVSTSRTIDLIITKKSGNIVISVIDHGCGMTKEIQNKLFKEMITTKGHNGSGLGLFMSYSTIKGNFQGDMNFTSELRKRFNV